MFDLPSLRGIRPRKYGLVSWTDHVPFAYDLMAELKPKLFVELGTHSGESYFAFCQSVEENHTGTVCYAVDTWKGDEQAGFYDESVYAEVARHNQEHYAGFSYLVRQTFDEALHQFGDGSIDLLHMDGLHTYEATRHDFDAWLPKVSNSGIILFHDIAARHGDFGAWKLWEEVCAWDSQSVRSFTFAQGWGLGVYLKNAAHLPHSPFLRALFSGDARQEDAIRRYYSLASENLRLRKANSDQASAIQVLEAAKSSERQTDAPSPHMQIYFPRDGMFAEELSRKIPLNVGQWTTVETILPGDFKGESLRIDPISLPGLIDIAWIRITSSLPGDVLWECGKPEDLANLRVTGTALVLPHSRYLRVLSSGGDPIIILPALSLKDVDEPLRLELSVRAWISGEALANRLAPLLEETQVQPSIRQELAAAQAAQRASEEQLTAIRQQLSWAEAALAGHDASAAATADTLEAARAERDEARRLASETQLQMAAVREELSAKSHALADASGQLSAAGNAADLFQESARSLREELASVQAGRAASAEAVQALRDELARLHAERAEQGNTVQALREELVSVQAGRAASAEAVQALRDELARLRTERAEHGNAVQALREEFFSARAATGTETLDLLAARERLGAVEALLGQAQAQAAADQGEREALRTGLLAAWHLLLGMDNAIKASSEDEIVQRFHLEDLRLQLVEAESNFAELTVHSAEKDALRKKEEAAYALREADAVDAAVIEIRDRLEDAEVELAEVRANLEEAHLKTDALHVEVAGLLNELQAAQSELAGAKADLADAQGRLRATQTDLSLARVDLEADRGRLDSMRESASWKLTLPLRAVRRSLTGTKPSSKNGLNAASAGESEGTNSEDVRETPFGYHFHIDSPANWNLNEQRVSVRGWALPPVAGGIITGIRLRANGVDSLGRYGLPRADVASAFGLGEEYRQCGFDVMLNLPGGPSKIFLEVLDEHGRPRLLGEYSVRAPYAAGVREQAKSDIDPRTDYAAWVERFDTFSREDRGKIRARARSLPRQPLISIVMPVYNTPEEWLVKVIESVRRQFYHNWELCVADDASPKPEVRRVLEHYEKLDRRIKVCYRPKNGHISAASNSALALASGEFVALLDHDDELPPHALYMVAEAVNAHPGVQLFYSDEDKIDTEGRRMDPYFKCDWNYELFMGQNMISHLGVYRRDLLEKVGGFTLGLEGSQDYDLALRCVEHLRSDEILHIPHVLYHWRVIPGSTSHSGDEKPYAREAARRAIQAHLDRLGRGARVEANPWLSDFHRIRHPLPAPAPRVAIIIPTRDALTVLRRCVESLFSGTEYGGGRFRVVIVDNNSEEPETLEYFKTLPAAYGGRCEVLSYPGAFNYAAINNYAVRKTSEELICLLNNDVEIISPEWMTELASHACRPEVGAAGARLLYPDNTLQHAGVIVGLGGSRTAGHAHHRMPREAFGYFGRAKLAQQFSAVTAACMVLRREVYEKVGGFDEKDLPVSYNDVDLCLRIKRLGYSIVWSPFAELYHHESYSRGGFDADAQASELQTFSSRHADFIQHDPAYSPNLTLDHSDFTYSVPPRSARPWLGAEDVTTPKPIPDGSHPVLH